MKAFWSIEGGSLKVAVKDGSSERSWTLRKSHRPEQLALAFGAIAEALGIPLTPRQVTISPPDVPPPRSQESEPAERSHLRRSAQQAESNAQWAHSSNDEDTMAQWASKVPEFSSKGDTTGFNTLPPPAAAVDGTVYDAKSYREDKSNWIKE